MTTAAWPPGRVASATVGGRVLLEQVDGWALAHDGSGEPLPVEDRVPMRADTRFDLASVTKVFTGLVLVALVEQGRVDLEEPLARRLPGYTGSDEITVRQLAVHTSGLPWWLPLWSDYPDAESRRAAVLACPPEAAPGTRCTYSDLNPILLQLLLEHVTGMGLAQLVREHVTGPIGMAHTGFGPVDPALAAATEVQTDTGRGLVRGQVHDENAWSLGGVSGHAGLFGTAGDLALLGRAVLDGRLGGPLVMQDQGSSVDGERRSLVFELDRPAWMGRSSTPRTLGHTGFTGTSLVLDPVRDTVAVLLTNRVHPTRDTPSLHPVRAAFAERVAALAEGG